MAGGCLVQIEKLGPKHFGDWKRQAHDHLLPLLSIVLWFVRVFRGGDYRAGVVPFGGCIEMIGLMEVTHPPPLSLL